MARARSTSRKSRRSGPRSAWGRLVGAVALGIAMAACFTAFDPGTTSSIPLPSADKSRQVSQTSADSGKTAQRNIDASRAERAGKHGATSDTRVANGARAAAERSEAGSRSRSAASKQAAHPDAQGWITVSAQRWQDGDSLKVKNASGQVHTLRLAGIDAPERTQPFSDRARKHLIGLIDGKPFQYQGLKQDHYGRTVALLRIEQVDAKGKPVQVDVNLAMLEAGLAWYFKRYERDLPAELRAPYQRAEHEARQHRRGLWSEKNPLAPWDFRRQKRDAGKAANAGASRP